MLVQESVELTPEVRGAVWSALGSLATAPVSEHTLSGFAALLQVNRLKAALEPYTIAGPFGRLLDAEQESVGDADVLAFETEDLLGSKHAACQIASKGDPLFACKSDPSGGVGSAVRGRG